MNRVYLDFNATTPVEPAVLDAMLPYFSAEFANAASIHTPGQRARAAVETAREQVARSSARAPRKSSSPAAAPSPTITPSLALWDRHSCLSPLQGMPIPLTS